MHFWPMNCPFVAYEVVRAFEGYGAADDIAAMPGFRSTWVRIMLDL
jgi:hypothetical protein